MTRGAPLALVGALMQPWIPGLETGTRSQYQMCERDGEDITPRISTLKLYGRDCDSQRKSDDDGACDFDHGQLDCLLLCTRTTAVLMANGGVPD
jgi:hypothetical protein